MESIAFPDNGGRRRQEERRQAVDSGYSPERRTTQDRRSPIDRRETPRM